MESSAARSARRTAWPPALPLRYRPGQAVQATAPNEYDPLFDRRLMPQPSPVHGIIHAESTAPTASRCDDPSGHGSPARPDEVLSQERGHVA